MTQIIKRSAFQAIQKHLREKEATVLIGPRQAGKTTLLSLLKEELIREGVLDSNILYFNLDRFSDLEFFVSQEEVIKALAARKGGGRTYLLIDEAQRIKDAGRFLKGIYDSGLAVKLVLTGSSSLEIRSTLVEPLTGRKRIFYLYPFTFDEFLGAKDPELQDILSAGNDMAQYDLRRIYSLLEEYLIFGGYPRVVVEPNFAEKIQILGEIYQSYLEKDIINFLKVKKPFLFKKLAGLLAAQIGQLVHINELSLNLNTERKTVENYLEILEETFVIKRVAPFFRNPRKELVKMPKIFFIDNGLRNLALDNFAIFSQRPDKGALLENFVATEILKRLSPASVLHFWRTQHGAEIDFILKEGQKIFPIEVKTQIAKPSLPRQFKNFFEDYPEVSEAFLINMNHRAQKTFGKQSIKFIYPHELSLRVLGPSAK